MKTTKILDSEIAELKISSLPSRPTAPSAFGGKGYSAKEMKEFFDKLPLFIIERLNQLIEDLSSAEDSVASAIKTGITRDKTLAEFFTDLTNGDASSYISVGSASLYDFCVRIREEVSLMRDTLSKNVVTFVDTVKLNSSYVLAEHARIYRLGDCPTLQIDLPPEVADEYFSEISFNSPKSPTSLSFGSDVHLSGDDVADGILMPKPNMHYTLFLWYDGENQGVVRGIENA